MARTNFASSPTSQMARIVAALKRDPKKTGVLAVLAVLLALMLLRTMVPAKPRRAAAATAPSSALTSGSTRGGSGKSATVRLTPRSGNESAALRKWSDEPVSPLSRNLFAIRLEYFPTEGPKSLAGSVKGRGDDGFWAKLEKSLALQADQRDKRENQIAHYMARAAQLKLQSTMMGAQPKALVNGEFVGEGDVVADFFRVVKIEARRMIVEREGIRLEIQMK